MKPGETKLDPPGISVLVGVTPQQAADQMRAAFKNAPGLHELSKITGSSTTDKIAAAGFMVIPNDSDRLPNHGRLIHPAGVAGFTPENLKRLSDAFVDVPTPP